jgi:transposase
MPPIHTVKIIRKYLMEQGITMMDWPPYSPDSNPVENLWATLKRKIYEKVSRTSSGG